MGGTCETPARALLYGSRVLPDLQLHRAVGVFLMCCGQKHNAQYAWFWRFYGLFVVHFGCGTGVFVANMWVEFGVFLERVVLPQV